MVAKIIRELKSHMIPYEFKCSHWLKLQHTVAVNDLLCMKNAGAQIAMDFS